MSLLLKAGITRLSELIIDVDKDWLTHGITNIKEIAEGMARGDLVVRDAHIIRRLQPGVAGYVLTSAGPGHMPAWVPIPAEYEYYFPAWLEMAREAGIHVPEFSVDLVAPMQAERDDVMVPTKAHEFALLLAVDIYTPHYSESEEVPVGSDFMELVHDPAIWGHAVAGATPVSIEDMIRGSRFVLVDDADVASIGVYVEAVDHGGATNVFIRAAIYDYHGIFVAQTDPTAVTAGAAPTWYTPAFPSPISLDGGREYWLVVFGADETDMDIVLYYDDIDMQQGLHYAAPYSGFPSEIMGFTMESRKYSIYGNLT